MLKSLYVKDFAIVGEAEVTFGPGLTVVTGETGAGKSLLVDALLLLAGARGEALLVRQGCERAELSAEFDLADRADLRQWLVAEELDEQGACQLRRVIRSEGSSRAWINGRPVTLGQLKQLAAGLIEIHGQHEHQALLERSQQLALLDDFGGHAPMLAEVADLARQWHALGARMAELSQGADATARVEWLTHQVEELERHALAAAPLAELEAEHRRLANAGELLRGCAQLGERLDGEDELALLHLVARAHAEATHLATLDARLAPLAELLDSAQIQLGEAGDTLARYQSALELDPERLADAEARLGKLHELARKHRVRMDELPVLGERLRTELEELRGASTRIADLAAQREVLAASHAQAAQRLTQARTATATRLGTAVSALMAELGMAGGRFEVALEPTCASEPDPQGSERVEFLVSANPGQSPRPLRKVASGGELARISLAIEVAALGSDAIATMVFDEVDSGIGGAVAEIVGHKLRALGARRQVLCVTHLAQVAAQGHAHLRVAKASDGEATHIRIDTLDAAAREEEIARMLGGIQITRETRAHARQMLQQPAGRPSR
ncbi:MAG: DNA repair protein RecN [Dokdonella sp.]|nr:MAG: DNA repair protein RecN [Dokdonella sp.]